MAHPNEAVIRRGAEALGRGDFNEFFAGLADDVVVHVPGRNSFADEHKGKDALAQVFQGQSQRLDGPLEIQVHDALGNDDHAVALNTVRLSRGGRTVETTQTIVAHVRDGKPSEVWINFGDQYAVDELMA